jgi:chemotaxis protein methyltransferase CheR
MSDQECVRFLQWALPRLQLRWLGFRKVRRQVCRRIQARIEALKLTNAQSYQAYLDANAEEWACLERLCRITISHFYRDRAVFELLQQRVLPAIVRRARRAGRAHIFAWSAGCASGEEPYTLNLLWRFGPWWSVEPDLSFRILATDIDLEVLRRARRACYGKSSLKQLPESWLVEAFAVTDGQYLLRPAYRGDILFAQHDVRQDAPGGPFDLVLCRNLVFTYFAAELQRNFTRRAHAAMTPEGVLVIGASETLPADTPGFVPWPHSRGVYVKQPNAD